MNEVVYHDCSKNARINDSSEDEENPQVFRSVKSKPIDPKDIPPFHCGICLDLLYDIRTTWCGHAFCYDCLEKLEASQNGKSVLRTNCDEHIRCPLCLTPTFIPPGRSIELESAIEILNPSEYMARKNQEQSRKEEELYTKKLRKEIRRDVFSTMVDKIGRESRVDNFSVRPRSRSHFESSSLFSRGGPYTEPAQNTVQMLQNMNGLGLLRIATHGTWVILLWFLLISTTLYFIDDKFYFTGFVLAVLCFFILFPMSTYFMCLISVAHARQ